MISIDTLNDLMQFLFIIIDLLLLLLLILFV